MWNYVVTAQKPTAVSHSVVGHFTSPNDLNLIIRYLFGKQHQLENYFFCQCKFDDDILFILPNLSRIDLTITSKCTRIEIHLLTPEGLQPLLDVGIYGKISILQLFRPQGEQQDLLLLVTERYKFCVLGYDSKTGEIVTRAAGDVVDRIAQPSDSGQLGIIDPECRVIGLHLYDGLLKVIPMDGKGQLKEAFNIRQEELEVIDIQFLYGCTRPTVCVLYRDSKDARHVRTYEVLLKEREFAEGPWTLSNVEAGANRLIPVPLPLGGALILGEHTITYHGPANAFKSIAVKPSIITAYGRIDPDGTRYLLGNSLGQLFMLVLEKQNGEVQDLKLELLGETSIPSTISYLDNGVVFVGSTFGDSQLIKLNTERDENGSYVEVLESFTNLGPIVDFAVVDLERQGQGQIVACSGGFKDGSLRVVRNGIGINEQATIDLPGVKGLWSLKPTEQDTNDKYIVLSFVGETRVLAMENEELSETEIAPFQSNEQTIYCGNVAHNQIIQITSKSIQLVDCATMTLAAKWSPPNDRRINVASCNYSQCLIATGGGNLIYIEIEKAKLVEVKHTTLEHEVSCVNIHPLTESNNNGNSEMMDIDQKATLCAVGMWTDISVILLKIPSLERVAKEPLGGEILPRSVLLACFEGINYLLCGLGDGHLFTFTIDMNHFELRDKKKMSLGTQQINLNTFKSGNSKHVFAASDRPTVIYSSNKKLLYSNVNLREVNHVCQFNSESFPDCLAIATEQSLTIGSIDDIQKLHIRTIPLGEYARRIAHQPSTNTLCIATIQQTNNPEQPEQYFVRLLDDQTYDITHYFPLQATECPGALTNVTFADDENSYYAVGTAFVNPSEPEPKKGRILIFQVVDQKLKLVTETEIKGAVYAFNPFNGKLLATVNSKVFLFKWTDSEEGNKQLVVECSRFGNIVATHLASRGDFIVVGDIMRSISLCLYKQQEMAIEEIARDYNPNWMTAMEVLDDDTFLGAENSLNFFTVKRNSEAATDEERSRLEISGEFHLGDLVNRFRHGSLVMKLSEVEGGSIPTIIYGSVSGAVGVIASLSQEQYNFFHKVEQNLNKVIKGVGGFKHSDWRAFSNDRKTVESHGFIDGDLIESFLDLKPEKMAEVVKGLDVSVEELTKRIETLQQATH